MGLPTATAAALRAVAVALEPTGVDWRLGGSGLLAALGLVDAVGDLDLTVAADDRDLVRAAFGAWGVQLEDGPPPAPWCSRWLLRTEVEGVEVEVIGEMCVVTPRGRVVVPVDLGGHLDLDGVAVPLADPAAWWWIYRAYKPDRAALLADVVPAARRAQLERHLGPPT